MKSGSSDEESVTILATLQSEIGINSIQGYYIYFDSYNIKDFVQSIDAWKKDGPIFVHMKLALGAAQKAKERKD